MPEKVARLSVAGGSPVVGITVGYAHWGKYDIRLFGPDGLDPVLVGAGLTIDQIPDTYPIAPTLPVAALHGHLLGWQAAIASYDDGDQPFSVHVTISQDDVVVPGGDVEQSGVMPGARLIVNFVRLEVA